MVGFLRFLFLAILASMLAVTSWASWRTPLFEIPRAVVTHPWFLATLADAYWGFVTFFVWVAWKERSMVARALWFVAIIGLGNIAMSLYVLRELFSVPADAPLAEIVSRPNPGRLLLPALLVGAAIAVYACA